MAAPDDPDDLDALWDDSPTARDPAAPDPSTEAVTSPHRSLDYLGGREAGFSEGVRRALAALESELRKAGLSPAEIVRIRRRVQQRVP